FFFFQAEDGIRDTSVTGVQTCALPISLEDLRAGCHGATAPFSPTARKLQRLHLHRIAATDWVSDLGARSMLDTSRTLLTELHAAGRKAVPDGRAGETRQAALCPDSEVAA